MLYLRGFILALLLFMICAGFGYAEVNDYLIMQDIGTYRRITQTINPLTRKVVVIPGYTKRSGSGILSGADHFDLDHIDTTYETKYESDVADLGVRVQVTQHAGADSDRWLLHEVDAEFRDYYGIPDLSYTVRNMDGHTILVFSSGGRDYRWLSGNKVIMIEYTALEMSKKPEPIEVVRAYLSKHPSTLPAMTLQELRSTANKTIWIKNEMERRLWLCEKWYLHLQMGKVPLEEALDSVVKSMGVFLDYRERYYGIKSKDEKIALITFLNQKDGTSIKNRLSTYKTWWAVNKAKSMSLP